MIHTQSEIDNLVELAIIQRAELKKLVDSLPQLRDHLSTEIERNLEEIEPAIRSELEQFVTARALDAHAQTSAALTAKIDELARSLESTTAARYSVLIAEREKNASLLAQAEARIAEAASALPISVAGMVTEQLARFPRAGEIDQLRKEFAEPKGLNPRGKWSPDETYQRLDLVTINGDSFVSNINGNRQKPSRTASDWTLNAARGNSGGGGGVFSSINELLPVPSPGQILGSQDATYVPKALVAGANITITESPTEITIIGDEGELELQDGTAAAPSLFFINDPDTGIYRPSANTLGISTSGVQRLFVDEDGVTTVSGGAHFDGEVRAANGNANNPTFSFTSDPDTGLYRHGQNELGVSIGGTERAVFTSTTFTITPNLVVSGTGTINGTSIPASKTLVVTTDKISALAATTSAELAGVISDETGTGSLVFANSPTLVTPALGTPSALVGTNITGTAAGLTAGTVTTNANLTGDVTSVGNATSIAAGVIVDADISASAAIADTKLATISTALKVSNSATTATSANTASAIVARDGSGDFSAGTITANLTGNVSGSSGSTTGNAATATALQTARAINGVNFDGTTAITVTAAAGTLSGNTLASGVTASSLTSLGTVANLTVTAGTISTTPSGSTDIANKAYVDSVAQGLDAKASCVAATTADITLSGAQTIDGVSVIAGDRVLVKNQTLSQNNGIYLCASGAWTRTSDADTWDELTSAFTFIEQGTTNADTGYVCTANAGGTLGTTALPWSQFSGAGTFTAGTGLTLTGSVFSLTSPVAVANGGTGISSFGTGVATFLGTPSSANLAAAVSDETGSGALVFANSPTLVSPALGTPSALVGTNITGTASGLTAGNVTTNANLTGAITSVGNATSLGSFTSANLASALTDETGSGAAVFATSPTLVTPILGTPQSGTLTSCTGLPISTGVSGLGTGVATALAVNVGSAGAPVVFNGALGTPSSGTVTNLTGTASININGTVGATTPSTVAGTTGFFSSTLFAGGVTTLRGANVPVANNSGFLIVGSSDAAAADLGGSIGFQANTTSLSNYPMGNISARLIATGAGVYRSYMAFATTTSAGAVNEYMRLTDAGLSVTGALSSTGILSGPGFRASKVTASSGLVKIQDEGANVYNVIGSRNNADSAALPLVFQGSNFDFLGAVAVTGALSSTGALAIGNTVNTVSPTSPNRTVTIVIGGTTYYLHAKTTND